MKIRTRIIVGLLLITGLGFYYLTNWIINDLRPHYLKSMEESLYDTSTLLASLLSATLKNGTIYTEDLSHGFIEAYQRDLTAKIYDLKKTKTNIRVYVTNKKGIVIFDSENGKNEGMDYSKWNDVVRCLRGEYGARSSRQNEDDENSSVLYVASPITNSNKDIIGCLTVCKPVDSINLFIFQARDKIMIGGAIAGLTVIALGILLSLWVTWPINKLTDYAHKISKGEKVSLPKLGTFKKNSHSEISIMAEAFEDMRETLEGKKYIEQYIQTLTHEIKSPVSAIQGASELLTEEMPKAQQIKFLSNIQSESKRIKAIIEKLLQLSSLENRKNLQNIEPISIPELLSDIQTSLNPVLTQKNINFEISYNCKVDIRGEKFLIRQSIENLIINAIDFSPKAGSINVDINSDGSFITIKISDEGPGIPEYALDKIFDRFYSLCRPDSDKKSSGLGLSFVKEAITLHNGTIEINTNSPKGTICTVTLPI